MPAFRWLIGSIFLEDWAKDQGLRRKAKIPQEIAFQTKPQIALEQIKATRAAGLPEGVVLMDAGYGNDTELRTQLTALGVSVHGRGGISGSVRSVPQCKAAVELRWPSGQSAKVELRDFNLKRARGPDD